VRKRDHFEALLEFGVVDEIMAGERARRELAEALNEDADREMIDDDADFGLSDIGCK